MTYNILQNIMLQNNQSSSFILNNFGNNFLLQKKWIQILIQGLIKEI